MVLKEVILTVSFERCGGLQILTVSIWEGMVVLKEVIFNSFYIWEGVVVLKELIFNSFYFGRVWWS